MSEALPTVKIEAAPVSRRDVDFRVEAHAAMLGYAIQRFRIRTSF